MKKLIFGAFLALGTLAATSAHAQTTTNDPATAAPQTSQSTQAAYDQQRQRRKMADQSVADNERAIKEQQNRTRDLENQLKAQRQQAKQQKEQLKMERQNAKAQRQQEDAAREQMKMQRRAEKEARKAQKAG